jgi:hypothetical protein
MANYSQKLANMRTRRQGLDSAVSLNKSASSYTADAANFTEAYEIRAKTEAIKYALGAMQELEAKYTKISIEEGDRVREQLRTGLDNAGIPVTFDYQGSVPLNIHIRFSSDIDLLVLHDGFVTADSLGPRSHAYTTLPGNVLVDMLKLRQTCEVILEEKFPAVDVDKNGAKSIALSGGSLRRKVDVVPSHWHDTAAYQQSFAKHDREVKVLNKDDVCMIANRPFLYMKKVEDKDQRTTGGTKKAIRLLKNIKKDSTNEITLSSYDIAALIWQMNDNSLNKPYYLELSLVAEVQKHLQFLVDNPVYAQTLDVPDQSRKILDSSDKLRSLKLLKIEVDELAKDIAHEIGPIMISGDYVQKRLMEAQIF